MQPERPQILAKALKLRELAIRGIDGEQANAKTFLATHMLKHNITEQELDEAGQENTQAYKFYNQYFTDQKMFESFLVEFFGTPGLIAYKLFKGFMSFKQAPIAQFKYQPPDKQD